MKVMLGGSISLRSIPTEISEVLKGFAQQNEEFLIGDAPGADKAFQLLLSNNHYTNVTIFHSGGNIRNNTGRWKTRFINSGLKSGHAMHTAKDRAMADESDIGLMVWDCKSVGTITNAARLLQNEKPCFIYSLEEDLIMNFQTSSELDRYLEKYPLEATEMWKRIKRFERRTAREAKVTGDELF